MCVRLFNYGIGIHLLESTAVPPHKGKKINPKDNHISFQCTDMNLVMRKLEEMNIEYVTAVVEEGGITVDQLFFHDPDGYMIEICNCQNLPVLPLSSCPLKLPRSSSNANAKCKSSSSFYGKFPFCVPLCALAWKLEFHIESLSLMMRKMRCRQAEIGDAMLWRSRDTAHDGELVGGNDEHLYLRH